ncbi:MAG: glycerol-3-phosphate dehydrogenase/oxidase [Limnobacter sp.]|uniref:glycerol-3-phosphate dehydrogenase/oxidase n=1 Tax=Limnobacter sp. TaxID=2003368 RepID=UPI0022C0EF64|nr:glycerol-3-phosphate dehydrogenase/oxidase [Limnobacter sp.]MCZ8015197.1 glycerol-3-phosphate dehydrogenase/oxidase [Limnobacter sp.]
MLSRKKHLEVLKARAHEEYEWDVIVIGGGATGLGSAVDAASRGLKVLLLEGHDFAKGTSSRATKLAHGGVRYLAQGNFSLVREALEERGRMLLNAPNLVKPLAFVIPVRNVFQKLFYWLGLKLYDLLAGKLGVGPTTLMKKNEVLRTVPTISQHKLHGGVRYFDAQFDDARLAIALMKTLHKLGGMAINYVPVTGFVKVGEKITAVQARDVFSGECFTFRSKAVINATGVWVDEIRQMDSAEAKPMLSPSQGVHVVVDEHFYPAKEALLVPKTSDGRVLFVVPWQGKTLIGTTDTPRADAPWEPDALPEEVDFILNTAALYLAKAPTRADVRSVFVGLRPLVNAGGEKQNTKSISREHTVITAASGLVTITGGKWTTYRSMAEEVVDLVCEQQGWLNKPTRTRHMRLEDDLPMRKPGSAIHENLVLNEAEIAQAVLEEMAVTIEDVLARRSRALFLDSAAALACMNEVRFVLQNELRLSDEELDRQEDEFRKLVAQYSLAGV